jgi:putative isomerase
VWLGLSHPKYSDMPEVQGARRGLCAQSERLLLVEWTAFRHVHENYNSTNGRGGDVGDSNPYYHWGALLGYIGMRENMMA